MIYCFWKNNRGCAGIPLCACPVDQPGEVAAEVVLFSAQDAGSLFPDFSAGEKVVLPGSFSARSLFSAVVVAQAAKIMRTINLFGSSLLFADGLIGEAMRIALPADIRKETVIARVSPGIEPAEQAAADGEELDPFAPGFIDTLKAMSGGEGFTTVIVASPVPELVGKAMGCAGVLGEVTLLLPILGKVSVDLTATVNFKSLIIRGRSIFSGLENLAARDIAGATEKINFLSSRLQAGKEESGLEIIAKQK